MYRKFFKRIIDFTGALVLLLVALIPFVISAVLIRIDSKGPVIFKQKRIGKGGKIFYIYKFRTMIIDTHKNGIEIPHEQRLTKVGKFLRKTSIDELPQILNILKGEMSFIGPRPWIEEYFEFFTEEQKRRTDVLPGLTGWAQAQGRNNLSVIEKINYDIYYIENLSLKMDAKTVLMTIATIFSTEGAEITWDGIKEEINVLRAQEAKKQI